MACLRGACRLSRGWSGNLPSACHPKESVAESGDTDDLQKPSGVWAVPPPSPAYAIARKLEQEESQPSRAIPPDILKDLQRWREDLVAEQAVQQQAASRVHSGPDPPDHGSLELITTEEGTGHKRPQEGSTVRMGYVVALRHDGSIVDVCSDFEYTLGRGERGAGEVSATALEKVLVQMRRGQVVSVSCTLQDIFLLSAPVCNEHGLEAPAILEVKLFEIYSTKDCSFIKGARDVVKEVLREGIGAWCDNPTDEGSAFLRIEEVRAADGSRIYPKDDGGPVEVRVTPGNGEVCDALECAMLEMRQHETALVTCHDSSFCAGGTPPLGDASVDQGASFRVTLLDYEKGPDVWSFDEEDRLKFATRRKLEATRLFRDGRVRLARERYRCIIELFHHMDQPVARDRFLGRPDLFQRCKELRKVCRLNASACSLRLSDPIQAKDMCDAVLRSDPESTKALYRRGQAHLQLGDYVQVCLDLERLLDIDSSVGEARRLLDRALRLRASSDRQQRKGFDFARMIDKMRTDPRSIKHDYMDTPVDQPGIEGSPIASRWKPQK